MLFGQNKPGEALRRARSSSGDVRSPGVLGEAGDAERAGQTETSSETPAEGSRSATRSPRSVRNENSSVLNPNLSFEGELRFTGTVVVDCVVKGSIVSNDTLEIGPSGNVNAEVSAAVVEISGEVRGNIKASTGVKIRSGGKVHGNIETPSISMEEGVVFEGACTRPSGKATPEPATASTTDEDAPSTRKPGAGIYATTRVRQAEIQTEPASYA